LGKIGRALTRVFGLPEKATGEGSIMKSCRKILLGFWGKQAAGELLRDPWGKGEKAVACTEGVTGRSVTSGGESEWNALGKGNGKL